MLESVALVRAADERVLEYLEDCSPESKVPTTWFCGTSNV